jgi:hypothetical protein
MADAKIRIIGEDKASSELKKVDGSLGGLKDNLRKAASEFAAFGAAAAAAGFTAKKIFDFGEAGAEVVQTAASFDILLEKVGAAPIY